MVNLETRYFNLNRVLLLAIGLWPYQQSKLTRFQIVLFMGILLSSIVFQLTTFVTAEFTSNLVIKVSSSTLCFTSCMILYNTFLAKMQTVKYLLEQLQQICNELKDKNEIDILERYGYNAKLYTARTILFVICSACTVMFLPIWPRIFDAFLLVNESRPYRMVYIMTEYFVDQEEYFYLILLHINVAICIGMIAMIATGTTLVAYLKYACGMFRIASYRIEQAIGIDMLRDISVKDENMINKRISYAVDIHRKAMEYIDFLMSKFEGLMFFLTSIGVLCLSLNLFGVASFGNNIEELLLHFVYVNILFSYMFLANYIGQEIIDHNNHVFSTAYNIRWYVAPVHIQKLILFLLQRGNKTFNITVAGQFRASLEDFAMLASASISYFTVIYSTQK